MKFITAAIFLLVPAINVNVNVNVNVNAFAPSSNSISSISSINYRTISRPQETQTTFLSSSLETSEPEPESSDRKEPTIDKPQTEVGSHEELLYTLGVNLARQLGDIRPLVETGEELTFLAKGMLDTVVGRLSEDGQIDLLTRRKQDLNDLITERANNIRKNVELAGESMLQTMSETEGVQTLPSGVRIHILEHGPQGPRPSASSVVKIHYHGTLPDGTIFDSTLGQDDPLNLAVGQLIPGFKQGILGLHEGDTAMIGIPCDLAYGDDGSVDGRVPGGAAIFFKVQLVEVVSAGIGGEPTLLGGDGKSLKKGGSSGGLLGANGEPM